MRYVVLLLLLSAAGCADTMSSGCHAPAFGLNPRHWQPSSADLQPCAAARRSGR